MSPLLLLLLLPAVLAASLEGKIVRTHTSDRRDMHYSWWFSPTPEGKYDADWKADQIKPETVTGVLLRLDNEQDPTSHLPSRTVSVAPDATFSIPIPDSGTYLLRFNHIAWQFPQYLISVEDGDAVITMSNPALGLNQGLLKLKPQPVLKVTPMRIEAPYKDSEPINILSVVKNPLVLMVGITLLVSYGLPKLTEGMDLAAMMAEARGDAENEPPTFKGGFVAALRN